MAKLNPGPWSLAMLNQAPGDPDAGIPANSPAANISMLSGSQSPLSMGGARVGMPMGSKNVSESKSSNDLKTGSTRNNYMDGDQIQQLTDAVMGTTPMQKQLQDSQGMHDLLATQAQAAGAKNHLDLSPLAAYADAENAKAGVKSNLAGSMPGVSDDGAQVMTGLAGQQKTDADMAKETTAAVKNLKDGADTRAQNDLTNRMLLNQIGGLPGQNGTNTARLDALRIKAGSAFDSDPFLKTANNVDSALDRAHTILTGKEPVTTQSLNIAQQDLINAVAQGGAATEGKVDREMMKSYETILNNAAQMAGQYGDLRKAPDGLALINQVNGMMGNVKNDWHRAAANRVDEMRGNYNNVADTATQQTAYDKADKLKGRYVPVTTSPIENPGTVTAKAAGHPSDDDISKMSKDQLKAYLGSG